MTTEQNFGSQQNHLTLVRRQFLQLAGAVAAVPVLTRVAWSQAYPARSVRVIVPYAAGSSIDVIARLIGQKLSESLSQQFYVENLPTGAANVGTAAAARAPADGYTILFVATTLVINPSLFVKAAYDPIKDFAPITLVAASPHVLVVHPSLPANDVKQFVELVRANPGKYSFASAGVGQSGHMAGELFKLSFGLDLVHVPFNGGAPAVISTIGGHTPIAFLALPVAAQHIKAGELRALAVTSGKRAPEFPDVPTLAEAGVPNQESEFIAGLLAPAGTSKEIVERLYREVARIVALPDVKDRLTAIGYRPVVNTPEEFGTWIKTEVPRWAKVIRDANIQRVE
jgi:tripartite-type tricarboxylate transporter receptor subunit TctC